MTRVHHSLDSFNSVTHVSNLERFVHLINHKVRNTWRNDTLDVEPAVCLTVEFSQNVFEPVCKDIKHISA